MSLPTILADDAREFRKLKTVAEKALAQIADEDFFGTLDPESNSIAFLIKHLAGNLRSRWTDFLTSDGEKPYRGRDAEFMMNAEDSRKHLLEEWEWGWKCILETLERLTEDDLTKTVYIRSEPHSVTHAVSRAVVHTAYHVGQIVLLAKHFAGPNWQTLTIPRGQSEEYVAAMRLKWKK